MTAQRPVARARSSVALTAWLPSPRPWNWGRIIQPISVTGSPSRSWSHTATVPAATPVVGSGTTFRSQYSSDSVAATSRRRRSGISSRGSGPPRCFIMSGSHRMASWSARSSSVIGRSSTAAFGSGLRTLLPRRHQLEVVPVGIGERGDPHPLDVVRLLDPRRARGRDPIELFLHFCRFEIQDEPLRLLGLALDLGVLADREPSAADV